MVSTKVLPIALLVSLGAFVQPATARDFLEELFGFGGSETQRAVDAGAGQGAAVQAHAAEPDQKKRAVSAGGTFCVRSCDGYFFPMPGVGKSNQQSMCEMACPSAAVDVYRGGSIETSRNARGQAYTSLSNAFSFRTRVTEKCGCNTADASSAQALKSLRQDPTLRNGDIVFDAAGASVYRGSGFASAENSSIVSAGARKVVRAVLALPRVAPVGESVADASGARSKTPGAEAAGGALAAADAGQATGGKSAAGAAAIAGSRRADGR